MNKRLKPPPVLDEQPKAEFVDRYKRYRCAENEVPFVEESQGPGDRFKSMAVGEHLVLKLELGKLIHVNGDSSGPMRTKSRYRLFWDGKQVGEAESLFSTTHVGEGSVEPRFYYNAECQSLLVFEELAWTTKRCIVFERSKQTTSSEKWTVKYIWRPCRPRHYLSANSDHGRIRGIGNGKLYLEMDGLLYAFPFDDFLLKKLEFTVG
ncbi:MAG: hypothetical protein K9N47_17860 [Prosthecobacter sp.]|uniref:hypothetical protein n=1 Tax=Prosthecobacter sp. TaxID=1965333 RepID=UPI0025E8BBDC|nr:hypothetical protein [Prosthecobacter sp.]MCF7787992.1 hypothetical protein [Prosthecobacter sp.]